MGRAILHKLLFYISLDRHFAFATALHTILQRNILLCILSIGSVSDGSKLASAGWICGRSDRTRNIQIERDSVEKVTTIELRAMIDDDADFVMINVLGVGYYEAARIPGSYNVPFNDPDFENTVQELVGSNNRSVIVYSAGPDDDESAAAAEKLKSAGFSDVADFEGGLLEWQSLGYAVESG